MDKPTTQPVFKKYGPSIIDTSKRSPGISAAEVAAALGAEPQAETIPVRGSLPMMYALRAELFRRRVPSGGRPGLEGTDQRVKIPVSTQDWMELQKIAALTTSPGATPSAAQVGSVLMAMALRAVTANPNASDLQAVINKAVAEELTNTTAMPAQVTTSPPSSQYLTVPPGTAARS